jgi:hypothetical protein
MSEKLINNNKFASLDSDNDSDNEQQNNTLGNKNNIMNETKNDTNKSMLSNKNQKNGKTFGKNNFSQSQQSIKSSQQSVKLTQSSQSSSNTKELGMIDKMEEEVMKQYYGKKIITNNRPNKYEKKNDEYHGQNNYNHIQNYNHDQNENDFIKVVSKKNNNKIVVECLYKTVEENLFGLQMSNYFKVLAHHNDDKSWDYNSYHNVTTLRTWGDLGTFFGTLNKSSGETNYTDFDLFVMKNEISPMWEDIENRNGSICSIKIDSLTDGYEIFKNLTVNMANNTLLKFNPSNWNTINGISFSCKKMDNVNETYCIILKIWFKMNILNFGSIEKIINDDINNSISKYSIKIKPIKPEY